MISMSNMLTTFWEKIHSKYVSEEDVWDAKRVVCILLRCVKCNSSSQYEIVIPKEYGTQKNNETVTSGYYFYNQLISALGTFRDDIDWETINEKDFLNYMVDEKFSMNKKKKVIDLLGYLSSGNQRKLSECTVLDLHSRIEMIKMLIKYVLTILFASSFFKKCSNLDALYFGVPTTTAKNFLENCLFFNCSVSLAAALLVLAKTITPPTGLSRRCTT